MKEMALFKFHFFRLSIFTVLSEKKIIHFEFSPGYIK